MKSVKEFSDYCQLISSKAIDWLSLVEQDAFDKLSSYLEEEIKKVLVKKKFIERMEVKTKLYPLKGIGLTLPQFLTILSNISKRYEILGYHVFFVDRTENRAPIDYYIQNPQWLNEIILVIE